jgi:hypothetical protein
MMAGPDKVFVAYAHLDATFRNDLEQQLKVLSRKRHVTWWSEHELIAGDDRLASIAGELENADIILILVSIHFLADDFCWSDLLETAILRHERRDALVIPVYVRPCPWEGTPIARLQGLPREAKPVSKWTNRHEAWTDVARGIQAALDSWRSNKAAR